MKETKECYLLLLPLALTLLTTVTKTEISSSASSHNCPVRSAEKMSDSMSNSN
jgi:hypothetical protein